MSVLSDRGWFITPSLTAAFNTTRVIRSFVKVTLLSLLLLPLASLGSAQPTEPSTSNRDWSENPNFAELREKLGRDQGFFARCESDRPLGPLYKLLNSKEWDQAAELGESWLGSCPIDIRVHYLTAIALRESGEEIPSQHHFRWFRGLMDSILATGDGKTPQTAYVTISISEEYDVLYFVGLNKKEQSLVQAPVVCDLLVATDEKGNEYSIYFNPKAHFERLQKMFPY